MRRIEPHSLWLGSVVDAWDLRRVLSAGIQAIVDLAANEAPLQITRDLIYCRFPIVDGTGNDPVLLRLAIDTLVALLRAKTESLLFCSAGMSRTPVIAAAAIATIEDCPFAACLERITAGHPHDVAPGLAADVEKLLRR